MANTVFLIIIIALPLVVVFMVYANQYPESVGLSKQEITSTIPDKNDPRVAELEKQGFTGYRILQILNCDPNDLDRGIRANIVSNATHVFDKINCVWNDLKPELNSNTTP